jgi:hypothetical protein
MSRFQPVHLPADRRLNGKASQTFLRHFNGCPRSGYLYALHKGEAQTADMIRGSAIHEILARATQLAVDEGEPMIPGELVKVEVDKVFAEMPVPVEQHDYVRECVWRWASETAFDPPAVIAVERLIVMQLEGFEVRMKVDYADLLEDGAAVHVVDYKSLSVDAAAGGGRAPSSGGRVADGEELPAGAVRARVGVRGAGAGGGVRGVRGDREGLRARLLGVQGLGPRRDPRAVPARRTRPAIRPGVRLPRHRRQVHGPDATPPDEPHPPGTRGVPAVADRAAQACPGGRGVGGLAGGRVRRGVQRVSGPVDVPDPGGARDHRGTINSHEQAAEALEVLDRRKAVDAAIRREVKAFAKHNGPVRWGADRVSEFVSTFAEEIKDREGMFASVERAVDFGEPFDRSVWVREKHGTSFRDRTLSADELAEEAIEREVE